MLYFRVKFEANNEPMYLGTRRGIEMWSAYAGGELFTETEVKNNSLNYDFLIPDNVNQRKTRMMGPYRVPTDDASITPWDYTADRRYDRFRPQPTMTIVHGAKVITKRLATLHNRPVTCYPAAQGRVRRGPYRRGRQDGTPMPPVM